jgi:hypothetical protein
LRRLEPFSILRAALETMREPVSLHTLQKSKGDMLKTQPDTNWNKVCTCGCDKHSSTGKENH